MWSSWFVRVRGFVAERSDEEGKREAGWCRWRRGDEERWTTGQRRWRPVRRVIPGSEAELLKPGSTHGPQRRCDATSSSAIQVAELDCFPWMRLTKHLRASPTVSVSYFSPWVWQSQLSPSFSPSFFLLNKQHYRQATTKTKGIVIINPFTVLPPSIEDLVGLITGIKKKRK